MNKIICTILNIKKSLLDDKQPSLAGIREEKEVEEVMKEEEERVEEVVKRMGEQEEKVKEEVERMEEKVERVKEDIEKVEEEMEVKMDESNPLFQERKKDKERIGTV